MLPGAVLDTIKEDLLDWHGCGMSVLEMTHRGIEFGSIIKQAEADLRDLLHIPANYHVLFLQGGGHLQFAMVPLNLLGTRHCADYVSTGYWSERAMTDARQYGLVNVAASSESTGYDRIPPFEEWRLSQDAAFVHYVSNDTAAGVEFSWIPDIVAVPLVADMSTNLLTKRIVVAKHALIYACAQKNVGVAGLTIVIIRDEVVGRALPITPRMLDYKCHVDNASMFNTPCTFAVYVAGLVLAWIKKEGGLEAMDKRHREMSAKLYRFLDGSSLFENRVVRDDRSRINVPFKLRRPGLEDKFIEYAKANGLVNLRGNLALGLRASMYNAMTMQGVERLIEAMGEFERIHA
jgi:phosphoserine aminotransferase